MSHVLLGGGDAEAFGLHPRVRGHGIGFPGPPRGSKRDSIELWKWLLPVGCRA